MNPHNIVDKTFDNINILSWFSHIFSPYVVIRKRQSRNQSIMDFYEISASCSCSCSITSAEVYGCIKHFNNDRSFVKGIIKILRIYSHAFSYARQIRNYFIPHAGGNIVNFGGKT